ncbi:MAG: hypothetical protein ABI282_02855 [Candidatus Baltobacteraceae bacterium]
MPSSQIIADAYRYAAVWSSFNPLPWYQGNPRTQISRYYVPPEDSNLISGNNLAWWKANHPDWILYTCDTNNNPTTQIAYVPGIGFPDVPLDIHNPLVIQYQLQQSLIPYLIANHYEAAAFDQINFNNILVGGNPELGQSIIPGYYACGVYQNGTFVRRYASKSDPQYGVDMLNWLRTARSLLNASHLEIFVNHTVQSQSDPNEIALLSLVDMEMVEPGFSDYGFYQRQGNAGVFLVTVNWMKWLQSHNVAIGIIDKFDQGQTFVSPLELEYSIATYLMGEEQGAYLFTAPDNCTQPCTTYGYGTEQWHQEYTASIGTPCKEMYGGATYDPRNPQIWYRRFSGGISVVNSGSLPIPSETATLPTNHTYVDLEGRAITNPLTVASNDAYVLLTGNGNNTGCQ